MTIPTGAIVRAQRLRNMPNTGPTTAAATSSQSTFLCCLLAKSLKSEKNDFFIRVNIIREINPNKSLITFAEMGGTDIGHSFFCKNHSECLGYSTEQCE